MHAVRPYAAFLSIVCVIENVEDAIGDQVAGLAAAAGELARDFEIVVVDNASSDQTLAVLKRLVLDGEVPNVQVYALSHHVQTDVAIWYGVERSIGDVYVVLDPTRDDVAALPQMLERHEQGADIVYVHDTTPRRSSIATRVARSAFELLLRRLVGVDYARDAPAFRLMSRSVVSFLAQQRDPASSYRVLPATAGFVRDYVTYASGRTTSSSTGFWDGFDRGLQLLVASTKLPLRLVSLLAMFGAGASLMYSGYVVVLSVVRNNLAEGWVSLSLVCSGMFFLISMVLMVLGEYVIHVTTVTNGAVPVHVSQEFTSTRLTTREQLNIESIETRTAAAS